MQEGHDISQGRIEHAVRPRPFAKRRTFWLDDDTLYWTIGNRTHRLRLTDIESIRIHFPGGSLEVAAQCVIKDQSGLTHSIGDRHWYEPGTRPPGAPRRFERRTATFVALLKAVTARLKTIHPNVKLLQGPTWLQWGVSSILGLLAIGMFVTGLYFIVESGEWNTSAFIYMLMAVIYMPFLWPTIRTRGPRQVYFDSLQWPADPAKVNQG